jgi:uncharacterized protein (TIGR03435 family)
MRSATLLCLSCGFLSAQAPTAKPAFEVVSIKPTSETLMMLMQSGKAPMRIDDAQFEMASIDLANLVRMAYHLPQDQISGPGWLEQERFAVSAKLPAGASKSQVFEMLQTMLAERFKIAVHHEQKVRPVYLLVVGKGPLKLKQSAGGDPDRQGCHGGRGGHHTCQNVSMDGLAAFLTTVGNTELFAAVELGRPVVDNTGLKAAYDFSMDYGRVGAAGGRRGDAAPADGGATEVSIAEAVKALGLNLEPGRRPFDILVIDHIERVPTEN